MEKIQDFLENLTLGCLLVYILVILMIMAAVVVKLGYHALMTGAI